MLKKIKSWNKWVSIFQAPIISKFMSIYSFLSTWTAQDNKVAVTFINERTEVLSGLKHLSKSSSIHRYFWEKMIYHFTHRASNSPTKIWGTKSWGGTHSCICFSRVLWSEHSCNLLLEGTMVREVCSKSVCFSRVRRAVEEPGQTWSKPRFTVTPDLLRLSVEWHFTST